MKTAKIGVLFLVALMALTGVTAGYAMWSETININGTVTTGTVGIKWSYVTDSATDDEISGKETTSSVSASLSADENTLTVTILGAYPCITYSVPFDITSTGTVPVHFKNGFVITPAYLSGIITIAHNPDAAYNAETADITLAQLHTGDSWHGILTFHITNVLWDTVLVPNGWVQGNTAAPYSFTVSIMGHQYNEIPS